jgi:hypothetical protein
LALGNLTGAYGRGGDTPPPSSVVLVRVEGDEDLRLHLFLPEPLLGFLHSSTSVLL